MEVCRNNVGNWPTRAHTGKSGARHDRQYYGIKDLAMAKDATCGFMIWDGTSKGMLTNVINLVSAEKKVLLYSAPKGTSLHLVRLEILIAPSTQAESRM
jgi:hypothetical protein